MTIPCLITPLPGKPHWRSEIFNRFAERGNTLPVEVLVKTPLQHIKMMYVEFCFVISRVSNYRLLRWKPSPGRSNGQRSPFRRFMPEWCAQPLFRCEWQSAQDLYFWLNKVFLKLCSIIYSWRSLNYQAEIPLLHFDPSASVRHCFQAHPARGNLPAASSMPTFQNDSAPACWVTVF